MIRPLPPEAEHLCDVLDAPAQLVAHLTIVHDVACELIEELSKAVPSLKLDASAIQFGSATHDLAKVLVPEEIDGPGNRHEELGPALLEKYGVPSKLARFARTHGRWRGDPGLPVEDLVVALADTVWCGRRESDLEERVAGLLPGLEGWEALIQLDQIVTPIADRGEERLGWQELYSMFAGHADSH